MLATYSDEGFVSDDYARELTAARTQAIEVERTSDDPPERIAAWLGTVNERALHDAGPEPDAGSPAHRGRRRRSGRRLAGWRLARSSATCWPASSPGARAAGRRPLGAVTGTGRRSRHPRSASCRGWLAARSPATSSGSCARRRKPRWPRSAGCARRWAPSMVRPLAETLANEDHVHTIRRLRELLIGFGAAGRQAVEPLKNSTNPAVRRTAIDLLRVFGGNEALQELTAMLADADPQVQQDSIRAIVQIGTPEAYGTLERACASSEATRDMVVRELVSLRDPKTIPAVVPRADDHRAHRRRGRAARSHHRSAGQPARASRFHRGAAHRAASRHLVGARAHLPAAAGRGQGPAPPGIRRCQGRARRGGPARAAEACARWRRSSWHRWASRERAVMSTPSRAQPVGGAGPPPGGGHARRAALRAHASAGGQERRRPGRAADDDAGEHPVADDRHRRKTIWWSPTCRFPTPPRAWAS